jgi:hypothetical protein
MSGEIPQLLRKYPMVKEVYVSRIRQRGAKVPPSVRQLGLVSLRNKSRARLFFSR